MEENKHFKAELLDPEKFVKANNLQEITNPIFFIRNGIPTSDGLLSNEIFGITKDQRANTFAYIDLGDWFLNPLVYKVWNRMDKRISEIVHGTNKFRIGNLGDFVEDPNGETGLNFLRKNIDKIKIRRTESRKRDVNIEFIERNKKNLFIKKYIVIPAFYRDVNTEGGYLKVGDINGLYDSLLIAVRGLKEAIDYGLPLAEENKGRVQEILLQIYNWFTMSPNATTEKFGIIRQSVLSKTTDYGSRLVMTAPQLKCEHLEDMETTLDYSSIPLASICVNFYPFILFWVRNFFETEFGGVGLYKYTDKKGKIIDIHVKDPLLEFSDDRIQKEINRFVHGYSNRFIPIMIPNEENKNIYMKFKGRQIDSYTEDLDKIGASPLLERDLTWCDLFYMAAVEVTKDKHVLITRYPMDSSFNQFPTKINVLSTAETEPMFVDNKFYKSYPKIRQEDIGTDTSNRFKDTLSASNLHMDLISGDYDGDQCSIRGVFSDEANAELDAHMNSKKAYVTLKTSLAKVPVHEGIQTFYCCTIILPDTKIDTPKFNK